MDQTTESYAAASALRNAVAEFFADHAPDLASSVSPDAWVAEMNARFPRESRPENWGVTALGEWLRSQGVDAGPRYVKALRYDWIRQELREATAGK